MKNHHERNDWENRLRPFPAVWERVQGAAGEKCPPAPPLMPGRCCRSKAVRFNPHRRYF